MIRLPAFLKIIPLSLALLGAGWWLGRHAGGPESQGVPALTLPTEHTRSTPDDLGLLVEDGSGLAPNPPMRPTSGMPALPSLDLPLRDVVGQLRHGARTGDRSAACRLSRSLRRCSNPDALKRYASESDESIANRIAVQTSANSAHTEALLQRRLALREDAHRWLEYCDGFPPASAEEIMRAQMRSAQLGDLDAMLGLAMSAPWSSGTALLQRPELAFAHRQSYRQAVRGLLEHDPIWTYLLLPQIGTEDMRPVVGDLVPEALRDPQLARVFVRLAITSGDPTGLQGDDGLPLNPDLLRRAENILRDQASDLEDFRARYKSAIAAFQLALGDTEAFDALSQCEAPPALSLPQPQS